MALLGVDFGFDANKTAAEKICATSRDLAKNR